VIWATYPQNDTVESLVGRMQQHAEDYLSNTGIELRFEIKECPPDTPLPVHQRVGLFHAFQEALTNVVRHAEATRVRITVTCSPTELFLSIRDDGKGFDLTAVDRGGEAGVNAGLHQGLRNMRRRVETCGGTLRIETGSGLGTTVRMQLPLG
jgi:signal transduction histidine kinase